MILKVTEIPGVPGCGTVFGISLIQAGPHGWVTASCLMSDGWHSWAIKTGRDYTEADPAEVPDEFFRQLAIRALVP